MTDLLDGLVQYRTLPTRLRMSRHMLDRIANDPVEGFPPRRKIGKALYVSEAAVREWIVRRFTPKAA